MSNALKDRINELDSVLGGLRAVARAIGVDAAYLQRLRDGEKTNPSEAVCKQLGLKKRVTTTYERA